MVSQKYWDAYNKNQKFCEKAKAYIANLFRKRDGQSSYPDLGTKDPDLEGRYIEPSEDGAQDKEKRRRMKERIILNIRQMLYEGDEQLQSWYVGGIEKDENFGYLQMSYDVLFEFLDLAVLESLEKAEEWQEKKGGARYAEMFPYQEIMEWVDVLMDKFEGWVMDRVFDKSICSMRVDSEERYKPQCFCAIWHLKQLPAIQRYLQYRDAPEDTAKTFTSKEL